MKQNNIKMCICSNTLKKEKVELMAKKLGNIDYVYFATKPLKKGLKKSQKILNIPCKNIAEIGDQYFTDCIGAKRMKMFSILTKPIEIEKDPVSRFKRNLEERILKKCI